MNDEKKESLRKLQWADQMLYDHFNDKLTQQIRTFGEERMAQSVQELKRLNKAMEEICVLGKSDKDGLKGTKFAPHSRNVVAYRVRY